MLDFAVGLHFFGMLERIGYLCGLSGQILSLFLSRQTGTFTANTRPFVESISMSLHFSSRRSFLTSVLSIAAVVVATEPALAVQWADAMFPIKRHDFGDVAVAAKCEVRFPIENKGNQTVHIKSVRASCGCTTPIIETNYIEPGQTGTILARFNTDTHRGKKGATLMVIIDKPNYAEVQLKVDGYIRQDLVFNPGMVEFVKIANALDHTRSVNFTYDCSTDF